MDLINQLNLKPIRVELRTTDTLYQKVEKRCPIYQLELEAIATEFKMKIEAISIDRKFITQITNPQIRKLKEKQHKIKGIAFLDENKAQRELKVDLLLGNKDYSRIRTEAPLVIGSRPY